MPSRENKKNESTKPVQIDSSLGKTLGIIRYITPGVGKTRLPKILNEYEQIQREVRPDLWEKALAETITKPLTSVQKISLPEAKRRAAANILGGIEYERPEITQKPAAHLTPQIDVPTDRVYERLTLTESLPGMTALVKQTPSLEVTLTLPSGVDIKQVAREANLHLEEVRSIIDNRYAIESWGVISESKVKLELAQKQTGELLWTATLVNPTEEKTIQSWSSQMQLAPETAKKVTLSLTTQELEALPNKALYNELSKIFLDARVSELSAFYVNRYKNLIQIAGNSIFTQTEEKIPEAASNIADAFAWARGMFSKNERFFNPVTQQDIQKKNELMKNEWFRDLEASYTDFMKVWEAFGFNSRGYAEKLGAARIEAKRLVQKNASEVEIAKSAEAYGGVIKAMASELEAFIRDNSPANKMRKMELNDLIIDAGNHGDKFSNEVNNRIEEVSGRADLRINNLKADTIRKPARYMLEYSTQDYQNNLELKEELMFRRIIGLKSDEAFLRPASDFFNINIVTNELGVVTGFTERNAAQVKTPLGAFTIPRALIIKLDRAGITTRFYKFDPVTDTVSIEKENSAKVAELLKNNFSRVSDILVELRQSQVEEYESKGLPVVSRDGRYWSIKGITEISMPDGTESGGIQFSRLVQMILDWNQIPSAVSTAVAASKTTHRDNFPEYLEGLVNEVRANSSPNKEQDWAKFIDQLYEKIPGIDAGYWKQAINQPTKAAKSNQVVSTLGFGLAEQKPGLRAYVSDALLSLSAQLKRRGLDSPEETSLSEVMSNRWGEIHGNKSAGKAYDINFENLLILGAADLTETVRNNWGKLDYAQLFGDSRLVLIGDTNHELYGNLGGIAEEMGQLKDAGVTHILFELRRDEASLAAIRKFNDPATSDAEAIKAVTPIAERTATAHRLLNLFEYARRAGIKIEAIDMPSAEMEAIKSKGKAAVTRMRGEYMGERIYEFMEKNPSAKVVALCGYDHLSPKQIPQKLFEKGISYRKVGLISAGQRSFHPWRVLQDVVPFGLDEAVRAAGHGTEAGYISLNAQGIDGVIRLPSIEVLESRNSAREKSKESLAVSLPEIGKLGPVAAEFNRDQSPSFEETNALRINEFVGRSSLSEASKFYVSTMLSSHLYVLNNGIGIKTGVITRIEFSERHGGVFLFKTYDMGRETNHEVLLSELEKSFGFSELLKQDFSELEKTVIRPNMERPESLPKFLLLLCALNYSKNNPPAPGQELVRVQNLHDYGMSIVIYGNKQQRLQRLSVQDFELSNAELLAFEAGINLIKLEMVSGEVLSALYKFQEQQSLLSLSRFTTGFSLNSVLKKATELHKDYDLDIFRLRDRIDQTILESKADIKPKNQATLQDRANELKVYLDKYGKIISELNRLIAENPEISDYNAGKTYDEKIDSTPKDRLDRLNKIYSTLINTHDALQRELDTPVIDAPVVSSPLEISLSAKEMTNLPNGELHALWSSVFSHPAVSELRSFYANGIPNRFEVIAGNLDSFVSFPGLDSGKISYAIADSLAGLCVVQARNKGFSLPAGEKNILRQESWFEDLDNVNNGLMRIWNAVGLTKQDSAELMELRNKAELLVSEGADISRIKAAVPAEQDLFTRKIAVRIESFINTAGNDLLLGISEAAKSAGHGGTAYVAELDNRIKEASGREDLKISNLPRDQKKLARYIAEYPDARAVKKETIFRMLAGLNSDTFLEYAAKFYGIEIQTKTKFGAITGYTEQNIAPTKTPVSTVQITRAPKSAVFTLGSVFTKNSFDVSTPKGEINLLDILGEAVRAVNAKHGLGLVAKVYGSSTYFYESGKKVDWSKVSDIDFSLISQQALSKDDSKVLQTEVLEEYVSLLKEKGFGTWKRPQDSVNVNIRDRIQHEVLLSGNSNPVVIETPMIRSLKQELGDMKELDYFGGSIYIGADKDLAAIRESMDVIPVKRADSVLQRIQEGDAMTAGKNRTDKDYLKAIKALVQSALMLQDENLRDMYYREYSLRGASKRTYDLIRRDLAARVVEEFKDQGVFSQTSATEAENLRDKLVPILESKGQYYKLADKGYEPAPQSKAAGKVVLVIEVPERMKDAFLLELNKHRISYHPVLDEVREQTSKVSVDGKFISKLAEISRNQGYEWLANELQQSGIGAQSGFESPHDLASMILGGRTEAAARVVSEGFVGELPVVKSPEDFATYLRNTRREYIRASEESKAGMGMWYEFAARLTKLLPNRVDILTEEEGLLSRRPNVLSHLSSAHAYLTGLNAKDSLEVRTEIARIININLGHEVFTPLDFEGAGYSRVVDNSFEEEYGIMASVVGSIIVPSEKWPIVAEKLGSRDYKAAGITPITVKGSKLSGVSLRFVADTDERPRLQEHEELGHGTASLYAYLTDLRIKDKKLDLEMTLLEEIWSFYIGISKGRDSWANVRDKLLGAKSIYVEDYYLDIYGQRIPETEKNRIIGEIGNLVDLLEGLHGAQAKNFEFAWVLLRSPSIDIASDYATTFLFGAGMSSQNLGRIDEAIRIYDRVLRRNPLDTDALLHKGVAHLDKGDMDKAIGCFTEVRDTLNLKTNLSIKEQVTLTQANNVLAAMQEEKQIAARVVSPGLEEVIRIKNTIPGLGDYTVLDEGQEPRITVSSAEKEIRMSSYVLGKLNDIKKLDEGLFQNVVTAVLSHELGHVTGITFEKISEDMAPMSKEELIGLVVDNNFIDLVRWKFNLPETEFSLDELDEGQLRAVLTSFFGERQANRQAIGSKPVDEVLDYAVNLSLAGIVTDEDLMYLLEDTQRGRFLPREFYQSVFRLSPENIDAIMQRERVIRTDMLQLAVEKGMISPAEENHLDIDAEEEFLPRRSPKFREKDPRQFAPWETRVDRLVRDPHAKTLGLNRYYVDNMMPAAYGGSSQSLERYDIPDWLREDKGNEVLEIIAKGTGRSERKRLVRDSTLGEVQFEKAKERVISHDKEHGVINGFAQALVDKAMLRYFESWKGLADLTRGINEIKRNPASKANLHPVPRIVYDELQRRIDEERGRIRPRLTTIKELEAKRDAVLNLEEEISASLKELPPERIRTVNFEDKRKEGVRRYLEGPLRDLFLGALEDVSYSTRELVELERYGQKTPRGTLLLADEKKLELMKQLLFEPPKGWSLSEGSLDFSKLPLQPLRLENFVYEGDKVFNRLGVRISAVGNDDEVMRLALYEGHAVYQLFLGSDDLKNMSPDKRMLGIVNARRNRIRECVQDTWYLKDDFSKMIEYLRGLDQTPDVITLIGEFRRLEDQPTRTRMNDLANGIEHLNYQEPVRSKVFDFLARTRKSSRLSELQYYAAVYAKGDSVQEDRLLRSSITLMNKIGALQNKALELHLDELEVQKAITEVLFKSERLEEAQADLEHGLLDKVMRNIEIKEARNELIGFGLEAEADMLMMRWAPKSLEEDTADFHRVINNLEAIEYIGLGDELTLELRKRWVGQLTKGTPVSNLEYFIGYMEGLDESRKPEIARTLIKAADEGIPVAKLFGGKERGRFIKVMSEADPGKRLSDLRALHKDIQNAEKESAGILGKFRQIFNGGTKSGHVTIPQLADWIISGKEGISQAVSDMLDATDTLFKEPKDLSVHLSKVWESLLDVDGSPAAQKNWLDFLDQLEDRIEDKFVDTTKVDSVKELFLGMRLQTLRALHVDESTHFGRAIAEFVSGNYAQALDELRELGGFAGSLDASAEINTRLLRGLVNIKMGEFDVALSQFDTILTKSPKNIEALLGKAWAHHRLKEYGNALVPLKTVLEQDPNNIEALLGSGRASFRLGEYGKALAYFDKVIGVEESNFGAWAWRRASVIKLIEQKNELIKKEIASEKLVQLKREIASYEGAQENADVRINIIAKEKTRKQIDKAALPNRIQRRLFASSTNLPGSICWDYEIDLGLVIGAPFTVKPGLKNICSFQFADSGRTELFANLIKPIAPYCCEIKKDSGEIKKLTVVIRDMAVFEAWLNDGANLKPFLDAGLIRKASGEEPSMWSNEGPFIIKLDSGRYVINISGIDDLKKVPSGGVSPITDEMVMNALALSAKSSLLSEGDVASLLLTIVVGAPLSEKAAGTLREYYDRLPGLFVKDMRSVKSNLHRDLKGATETKIDNAITSIESEILKDVVDGFANVGSVPKQDYKGKVLVTQGILLDIASDAQAYVDSINLRAGDLFGTRRCVSKKNLLEGINSRVLSLKREGANNLSIEDCLNLKTGQYVAGRLIFLETIGVKSDQGLLPIAQAEKLVDTVIAIAEASREYTEIYGEDWAQFKPELTSITLRAPAKLIADRVHIGWSIGIRPDKAIYLQLEKPEKRVYPKYPGTSIVKLIHDIHSSSNRAERRLYINRLINVIDKYPDKFKGTKKEFSDRLRRNKDDPYLRWANEFEMLKDVVRRAGHLVETRRLGKETDERIMNLVLIESLNEFEELDSQKVKTRIGNISLMLSSLEDIKDAGLIDALAEGGLLKDLVFYKGNSRASYFKTYLTNYLNTVYPASTQAKTTQDNTPKEDVSIHSVVTMGGLTPYTLERLREFGDRKIGTGDAEKLLAVLSVREGGREELSEAIRLIRNLVSDGEYGVDNEAALSRVLESFALGSQRNLISGRLQEHNIFLKDNLAAWNRDVSENLNQPISTEEIKKIVDAAAAEIDLRSDLSESDKVARKAFMHKYIERINGVNVLDKANRIKNAVKIIATTKDTKVLEYLWMGVVQEVSNTPEGRKHLERKKGKTGKIGEPNIPMSFTGDVDASTDKVIEYLEIDDGGKTGKVKHYPGEMFPFDRTQEASLGQPSFPSEDIKSPWGNYALPGKNKPVEDIMLGLRSAAEGIKKVYDNCIIEVTNDIKAGKSIEDTESEARKRTILGLLEGDYQPIGLFDYFRREAALERLRLHGKTLDAGENDESRLIGERLAWIQKLSGVNKTLLRIRQDITARIQALNEGGTTPEQIKRLQDLQQKAVHAYYASVDYRLKIISYLAGQILADKKYWSDLKEYSDDIPSVVTLGGLAPLTLKQLQEFDKKKIEIADAEELLRVLGVEAGGEHEIQWALKLIYSLVSDAAYGEHNRATLKRVHGSFVQEQVRKLIGERLAAHEINLSDKLAEGEQTQTGHTLDEPVDGYIRDLLAVFGDPKRMGGEAYAAGRIWSLLSNDKSGKNREAIVRALNSFEAGKLGTIRQRLAVNGVRLGLDLFKEKTAVASSTGRSKAHEILSLSWKRLDHVSSKAQDPEYVLTLDLAKGLIKTIGLSPRIKGKGPRIGIAADVFKAFFTNSRGEENAAIFSRAYAEMLESADREQYSSLKRASNKLASIGIVLDETKAFRMREEGLDASDYPKRIAEMLALLKDANPQFKVEANEIESMVLKLRSAGIPVSQKVVYGALKEVEKFPAGTFLFEDKFEKIIILGAWGIVDAAPMLLKRIMKVSSRVLADNLRILDSWGIEPVAANLEALDVEDRIKTGWFYSKDRKPESRAISPASSSSNKAETLRGKDSGKLSSTRKSIVLHLLNTAVNEAKSKDRRRMAKNQLLSLRKLDEGLFDEILESINEKRRPEEKFDISKWKIVLKVAPEDTHPQSVVTMGGREPFTLNELEKLRIAVLKEGATGTAERLLAVLSVQRGGEKEIPLALERIAGLVSPKNRFRGHNEKVLSSVLGSFVQPEVRDRIISRLREKGIKLTLAQPRVEEPRPELSLPGPWMGWDIGHSLSMPVLNPDLSNGRVFSFKERSDIFGKPVNMTQAFFDMITRSTDARAKVMSSLMNRFYETSPSSKRRVQGINNQVQSFKDLWFQSSGKDGVIRIFVSNHNLPKFKQALAGYAAIFERFGFLNEIDKAAAEKEESLNRIVVNAFGGHYLLDAVDETVSAQEEQGRSNPHISLTLGEVPPGYIDLRPTEDDSIGYLSTARDRLRQRKNDLIGKGGLTPANEIHSTLDLSTPDAEILIRRVGSSDAELSRQALWKIADYVSNERGEENLRTLNEVLNSLIANLSSEVFTETENKIRDFTDKPFKFLQRELELGHDDVSELTRDFIRFSRNTRSIDVISLAITDSVEGKKQLFSALLKWVDMRRQDSGLDGLITSPYMRNLLAGEKTRVYSMVVLAKCVAESIGLNVKFAATYHTPVLIAKISGAEYMLDLFNNKVVERKDRSMVLYPNLSDVSDELIAKAGLLYHYTSIKDFEKGTKLAKELSKSLDRKKLENYLVLSALARFQEAKADPLAAEAEGMLLLNPTDSQQVARTKIKEAINLYKEAAKTWRLVNSESIEPEGLYKKRKNLEERYGLSVNKPGRRDITIDSSLLTDPELDTVPKKQWDPVEGRRKWSEMGGIFVLPQHPVMGVDGPKGNFDEVKGEVLRDRNKIFDFLPILFSTWIHAGREYQDELEAFLFVVLGQFYNEKQVETDGLVMERIESLGKDKIRAKNLWDQIKASQVRPIPAFINGQQKQAVEKVDLDSLITSLEEGRDVFPSWDMIKGILRIANSDEVTPDVKKALLILVSLQHTRVGALNERRIYTAIKEIGAPVAGLRLAGFGMQVPGASGALSRQSDYKVLARTKLAGDSVSDDIRALIEAAKRFRDDRLENELLPGWDSGSEARIEAGLGALSKAVVELRAPIRRLDPLKHRRDLVNEFNAGHKAFTERHLLSKAASEELEEIDNNPLKGNMRTVDLNNQTKTVDMYVYVFSILEMHREKVRALMDIDKGTDIMNRYGLVHEWAEARLARLTNKAGNMRDLASGVTFEDGRVAQYTSDISSFKEAIPILMGLEEISRRTNLSVEELMPIIYLQPLFGLDPVDARAVAELEATLVLIKQLEERGVSLVEVLTGSSLERIELTRDSLKPFTAEEVDKAYMDFMGSPVRAERTIEDLELVLRTIHTIAVSVDKKDHASQIARELLKRIHAAYDEGEFEGSFVQQVSLLYEQVFHGAGALI